MTAAEINLLIPQWGTPAARPILTDPWDRPRAELSQQAATAASLKDRPDFGWALAERLAKSGHSSTLLKRPAYRWVRAAVQLLTVGPRASRRLKDVTVVSQAREIHEADQLRPVVNAALMTRDATARSVADALHLDVAVVDAYSNVFFNVLDRRNDIGYVRKLLGVGDSSPLMVPRHIATSDEEELLSVGFKGTIEDVLRHAGCVGGAGDESTEDLSNRVLRNMLVAGADWTASPNCLRQSPPAMVAHAIDLVKKSKSDSTQEAPIQLGMNIGSLMREQLERDAQQIRRGVEECESVGLPN
ncbi:MAG: hypothetical protein RLZZ214_421 [Verrucomicrobiota bacterium]|jgi:hypothetical protein